MLLAAEVDPTLPPHLRTGQHSGALSSSLQHTIQTQLQICGVSTEREKVWSRRLIDMFW